jgi:LysR family transcriptional regulator, carnitine catabolism transcriptional activator
LAVVDTGGFSAAADKLGMTPHEVTSAVAEVEAEQGVTLLNRIGGSVRLSFAGVEYLPTARLILRNDANPDSSGSGDPSTGRLDLACLPTLAVAPVAPMVGKFRSLHAGVTIHLADPQDTAELLEFVRSGFSEIGIGGTIHADDLTVIPLDNQDFCVVLPPGSLVTDPLPVALLADMPLVATPRGSSSRDHLDEVLGQVIVPGNIVVETAQREALLPLIIAGAGSALLPRPLAETARRLGCVVVETDPPVSRSVSMVHRNAPLTIASQLFIEFARRG